MKILYLNRNNFIGDKKYRKGFNLFITLYYWILVQNKCKYNSLYILILNSIITKNTPFVY